MGRSPALPEQRELHKARLHIIDGEHEEMTKLTLAEVRRRRGEHRCTLAGAWPQGSSLRLRTLLDIRPSRYVGFANFLTQR
jgi:hypothetical protein